MKRNFDIEKVAAAIEAAAGHALPAPRWGFRKPNLPRVVRHPPEPCVTGSKAGLRRLVRLCACCAC